MAADLPPEILILIWVGGPVIGGFLGAIGADLWKSLKRFISKIFNYYRNKKEPIYNPNIIFEIRMESEPRVRIIFPTKNSKELKKGLTRIDKYLVKCKLDKSLALYFYKGKWINQGEYFKELELND